MTRALLASVTVTGCIIAVPAAAQPPRVINARVVPQSVAGGLDGPFHALVTAQVDPAWIGYRVPMIRGDRTLCCGGDGMWSARCGLEPAARSAGTAEAPARITTPTPPVRLEGPDALIVLYRVEARSVDKIRVFSPDCELDAGGRTIYWLDAVKGAESIALLRTLAAGDGQRDDRVANAAITAIALHGDDTALPTLIQLARRDPSARVRGDALFWLAQRAGDKAAGEITAAIEQDPDTAVKKRAVFALSQLPKDEGVPLLIQVARTNRNPVVRKQAMFWLGQSRDPRALAFFEEVLR